MLIVKSIVNGRAFSWSAPGSGDLGTTPYVYGSK